MITLAWQTGVVVSGGAICCLRVLFLFFNLFIDFLLHIININIIVYIFGQT
jgi:hypothetical protein